MNLRTLFARGIVGNLLVMHHVAGNTGSVSSHYRHNNDDNNEKNGNDALSFRVRSLFKLQPDPERKLLDFIPTFSEDSLSTEMPILTLEFRGLSGNPLSEDSYDAIQYAMTDYLYDLLGPRWPFFSTSDFDAGQLGIPGASSRNPTSNQRPALRSINVEVVNDQPLSRRLRHNNSNDQRATKGRRSLQTTGNSIDLRTTLTFRDLTQQRDVLSQNAGVGSGNTNNQGSNAESDTNTKNGALSLPPDEMLVGAAGDAWNDLTVFEEYLFDAIGRQGSEVVAEFANLQSVSSTAVFPTTPPTVAPTTTPTDETSPADPDETGDKVVSSINDSSNLQAPQTGIDPLYPALIAGIAVFLCTIIVLGYRRRRSSDLIGNKADPAVNVHDTFTLDGDEEIEVEDPFVDQRLKKSRRQSSQSDDSDSDDIAGRGLGLCGRNPICAPRTVDPILYQPSFEEEDRDHERYSEQSRFRSPPIAGVPQEDMDLYADLTPAEKKQFLRYMHSGMSIEEASRLVLESRQNHLSTSAVPTSSRRGMSMADQHLDPRQQQQYSHQINSEVMPDGQTTVHIPHYMSGHPVPARPHNRSLVLEEADSSVDSSFDDRDYHRHNSGGGMGNLLNIGRSKTNDHYSEVSGRSKRERRRGRGRSSRGSDNNKGGVGGSILCNPELGL
ncbi:hypothetical protein IV203_021853 [Nitzschia inconspicua]|uniref:Uncharacterized protein n=1 Tax=Nitzschia inconspicua TaxID=303405 RepID=A0A9K3K5Y6_9STRA|nr:hypothetical protein IV203_033442 [Nitzschia inconspicua]KAG7343845.1 hypothetical protein IV203_021853 [Nitzschia inconspicua]